MFDSFYSEEAYELAVWAKKENNRVKASKIMMVAEKIERENRKRYGGTYMSRVRLKGPCYDFPRPFFNFQSFLPPQKRLEKIEEKLRGLGH